MASNFIKRRNENLSDGEMSFVDHLEALRWHIIRALLAIIICAVVVFIYIDNVLDIVIFGPLEKGFITYEWLCKLGHKIAHSDALCLPAPDVKMQTTTFGGQFVSSITIAIMSGVILAFPYIFWETWRFIKPALKQEELKHTSGAIFWVSFFFLFGVCFGYFMLAPFTFSFLSNYKIGTHNIIETKPVLDDYINNLVDITIGSGLSFELPVISFVLTRIGLITPLFLREYRKYAYIVLLAVAAVITPSPDWMSQMIVVLPLALLYELSIIISARVAKKEELKEKEWS